MFARLVEDADLVHRRIDHGHGTVRQPGRAYHAAEEVGRVVLPVADDKQRLFADRARGVRRGRVADDDPHSGAVHGDDGTGRGALARGEGDGQQRQGELAGHGSFVHGGPA